MREASHKFLIWNAKQTAGPGSMYLSVTPIGNLCAFELTQSSQKCYDFLCCEIWTISPPVEWIDGPAIQYSSSCIFTWKLPDCLHYNDNKKLYLLIFFRTLLQDIYKIAKCTSTLLYLKHQNMSLSHDYYSYILASFQSFLLIHTFYFVLQTFAFRWGKKYCLLKFTHKLFSPFLHEYTTQCFTNYSICFFTWTLRVCQSLWLDCKMLKLISGFGKVILPDYLADFKCDELQGTNWVLIFTDFRRLLFYLFTNEAWLFCK